MPASASLVTMEYKINILAPATADMYASDGRHVAAMQQTLMMLPETPDHPA